MTPRCETTGAGGSGEDCPCKAGARAWVCALTILATSIVPTQGQEEALTVSDLGFQSGFQDYWDNHYRRGRSIVAEDFDGDGRLDYFIGNPGDESFIFRNLGPGPDGQVRFAPAQVLLSGDLAFVASGADYDNGGDVDLFIGCGGLEGSCLDFLFRNDSVPGRIEFKDVTGSAGISGPGRTVQYTDGPEYVILGHSTGGGTWGDYDRDGDPDLFVSLRGVDGRIAPSPGILWRNDGGGIFSDATVEAGLSEMTTGSMIDFRTFQNSTWIDADNDGDLDLFLNNARGANSLRKNLLVEQRTPRFVDATSDLSLPGEDLRFPYYSFASAAADFNNDGWQDLILFAVGRDRAASPYGYGNGLFLNREGRGFFNVAARAGINSPEGDEMSMGCQVADLNADGVPDLVIGAGGPSQGTKSRLLLSRGIDAEAIPVFEDASALIDFEPPHGIDPAAPPYPQIPPYPYRTHGMAAGDADEDGGLELAVVDGGPAQGPAIVREPNRLFRFSGPGRGHTFRAFLKGNGLTDSRDAIGARAYVEIRDPIGATRRVFQTVLAGSGFSAQNERTLTFGLGGETSVSRLMILWPSGCLQAIDDPRSSPSPLVVEEACWSCRTSPGPVQAWLDPDAYGCARPPFTRIEGTLADASGPVSWTRVIEHHENSSSSMPEARSGPDGRFSLQHSYEPGICRVSVVEPFGYVPVSNPVWVKQDAIGAETLDLMLTREPEARWPRGVGYWLHHAKAAAWEDRRHAHEGPNEMAAWAVAIRARYPGLGGFESPVSLAAVLEGKASHQAAARLQRHLAAALLNLASGRLSSYTRLSSGERIDDLVERAYRWLGAPDADPSEGAALADGLEALNEGALFP